MTGVAHRRRPLSLAKTRTRPKSLGFQGITRNPQSNDLLVHFSAPSDSSRTEIPPQLAARKPGFASPTFSTSTSFQPTSAEADRSSPRGVAHPRLGWVENSELCLVQPRSVIRWHPSEIPTYFAMEKPTAQHRPEIHCDRNHHLDWGDEPCQPVVGNSQN